MVGRRSGCRAGLVGSRPMGSNYRPWDDAAQRHDLEVMVTALPAGVRALHATDSDGHRAILIDRNLPPIERLAALAHELAHDDSGGGCHQPGLPPLLRPLVTRDEQRVDRIAAERLLPLADLAWWVDREEGEGRAVTVEAIAEAHQVATSVAAHQARALQRVRARRVA